MYDLSLLKPKQEKQILIFLFISFVENARCLVRWLNKKIVTHWIKAPNFAHVFFRCLSNILEGGARATTPGSG